MTQLVAAAFTEPIGVSSLLVLPERAAFTEPIGVRPVGSSGARRVH